MISTKTFEGIFNKFFPLTFDKRKTAKAERKRNTMEMKKEKIVELAKVKAALAKTPPLLPRLKLTHLTHPFLFLRSNGFRFRKIRMVFGRLVPYRLYVFSLFFSLYVHTVSLFPRIGISPSQPIAPAPIQLCINFK